MSGTVPGFAAGQETELYGIGSGEAATAPTSQVLGNSWDSMWGDENPTARLFYAGRRNLRDIAARDAGTERYLTAEEANAQYGIPGVLTFSRPMAESSARELRERAQARAAREDIAARANSGAMEWTARGAISLVAAALDPLNVASAFVPVVSQTRAAAWVGAGGGAMGRIAASARVGAIEGTAGALMLEPVMIGLAGLEGRQDYGMADSLLNVAFGAGFGALLHGAGRGIIDGFRGIPADPRLAAEIHETAVRAAAAQVQRGDPVDVRPVFDAGRATGPEVASPDEALGRWRTANLSNAMNPEGIGNFAALSANMPEGWSAHGAGEAGMMRLLREGIDPERQFYTGDFSTEAAGYGVSARMHNPFLALYGPGEPTDAIRTVVVNMEGGEEVAASLRAAFPGVRFLTPEEAVAYARAGGAAAAPTPAAPAGQGDLFGQTEPVSAIVQRAAAQQGRPEDVVAVARASEARARAEGGQRVETRVAQTEAAAATLTKEAADTDAVLAELVRAGRITQAEADAVNAPAVAERVKQRVAGIEAAAACLIANGA